MCDIRMKYRLNHNIKSCLCITDSASLQRKFELILCTWLTRLYLYVGDTLWAKHLTCKDMHIGHQWDIFEFANSNDTHLQLYWADWSIYELWFFAFPRVWPVETVFEHRIFQLQLWTKRMFSDVFWVASSSQTNARKRSDVCLSNWVVETFHHLTELVSCHRNEIQTYALHHGVDYVAQLRAF